MGEQEYVNQSEILIGNNAEKYVRRLVVEWPSREDLMARKEKYIEDNKALMSKELKTEYLLGDESEIEKLSNVILSAKFIFLEMNRISPIPLNKQFSISDDFEYQEDGALMGICRSNEDICLIHVDSFWQLMSEGVNDLDIIAMGAAVHEFAHMIYKQEAVLYGKPKKVQGWEEKEKRQMSSENQTDAYLAVDPEIRARIWQLRFLKKFFPESEHIQGVQRQIERGMRVRVTRRKTSAKI